MIGEDEMMIGFIIWLLCGLMFIGFGISAFCAEKPVGFWANVQVTEIENVKEYNKAVGRLWCVAGFIFILLGFPFLIAKQNSPLFFISAAGVVLEIIVVMVVYSLGIERKYRKK